MEQRGGRRLQEDETVWEQEERTWSMEGGLCLPGPELGGGMERKTAAASERTGRGEGFWELRVERTQERRGRV